MRELIDKYRWADDDEFLAWTVAVVEGRTRQEVISIYGGDPTKPIGHYPFNDAWVPEDDFGKYFHLQVLEHEQYVVAIEPNGWTGKVPEIARRASADGGRFFSVFWNVEGRWYILEAEDGTVTAAFDVVLQPASDVIPDWSEGVDFATTKVSSLCLALMERQTGLAFDSKWLDDPLPTYRIPDADEMLVGIEGAREA